MKSNFEYLKRTLDEFDTDTEKSLWFYNNPRARAKLVQEILSFSVARLNNITEPVENNTRVHELIRWLDNNYQGNEWPLHEVHFHPTFFNFCTCTFTCLNEISSVMEKIIQKRFAA